MFLYIFSFINDYILHFHGEHISNVRYVVIFPKINIISLDLFKCFTKNNYTFNTFLNKYIYF